MFIISKIFQHHEICTTSNLGRLLQYIGRTITVKHVLISQKLSIYSQHLNEIDENLDNFEK